MLALMIYGSVVLSKLLNLSESPLVHLYIWRQQYSPHRVIVESTLNNAGMHLKYPLGLGLLLCVGALFEVVIS